VTKANQDYAFVKFEHETEADAAVHSSFFVSFICEKQGSETSFAHAKSGSRIEQFQVMRSSHSSGACKRSLFNKIKKNRTGPSLCLLLYTHLCQIPVLGVARERLRPPSSASTAAGMDTG